MLKVFLSYCHADEGLCDELNKHFSSLKREGLVDTWHDRKIEPGTNIGTNIDEKLNSSDIILLLISSDFINSEYCYSKEMTRALERHERAEAKVIPIILRHCDWHSAPFGSLNALPADGRPIKAYVDLDEAMTEVTKELRVIVNRILSQESKGKVDNAVPQIDKQPSVKLSEKLNLPLNISDFDKDHFARTAFELTADTFEKNLGEASNEDTSYQGVFQKLDQKRFEAKLYRNGELSARCYIRLGALYGSGENILYSSGVHMNLGEGSYSDVLSVQVKDENIFLISQHSFHSNRGEMNAVEGAKYLWNKFTSEMR